MEEGISLEKLNLRTPKAYDYTAQSEKDDAKIFYYCVSEGATEESYFKGIENSKKKLEIDTRVHIEILEKQVIPFLVHHIFLMLIHLNYYP